MAFEDFFTEERRTNLPDLRNVGLQQIPETIPDVVTPAPVPGFQDFVSPQPALQPGTLPVPAIEPEPERIEATIPSRQGLVDGFQTGGVASTAPGQLRPLTREDQARQDAIRARIATGDTRQQQGLGAQPPLTQEGQETLKALGGGAEAEKMVREAEQETKVREVGERIGARAQIDALRKRGMSDDDIKSAIGTPEDRAKMGAGDTFRALNRLRMREERKAIGDATAKRTRDRLSQRSARDEEGKPKNRAAVAQDLDNWALDAPDPTNPEKTNLDRLSKSEQREVKRYIDAASRGTDTKTQRKRMEQLRERTDKKTVRAGEARQAELAGAELQRKIDKAATDAEKAWYSTRQSQLSALDKQLERSKKTGGREKKARDKRINEERDKVLTEITAGFTPQATAQTATTPTQAELQAANEEAKSAGQPTFTIGGRTFGVK